MSDTARIQFGTRSLMTAFVGIGTAGALIVVRQMNYQDWDFFRTSLACLARCGSPFRSSRMRPGEGRLRQSL